MNGREPAGSLTATPVRRLWWQFFRRDLAGRFAGSSFGTGWALIQPVALLALYDLVFSTIFKARGAAGAPYIVFLALGLWPWLAVQESISRATTSVTAHADLVRKVHFDQRVLALAAISASFSLQVLGLLVVLAYVAAKGLLASLASLPLLIYALALLLAIATVFGLMAAALNVYLRDLEQAVPPALALVFYLSPILYDAAAAPAWVQAVNDFNPVAIAIGAVRDAVLIGRALPSLPEVMLGLFSVVALCAVNAGFNRLSEHFEELL